jgi:alkaline phosphatase
MTFNHLSYSWGRLFWRSCSLTIGFAVIGTAAGYSEETKFDASAKLTVTAIESQPKLATSTDPVAELQSLAKKSNFAEWGFWGTKPKEYSAWTNHSNRLIPIYVFGGEFAPYMGERSIYRDAKKLESIYCQCPDSTCCSTAEYGDQTDVYQLQKHAIEVDKKKYVFLVVFDGMDWQTTHAAATYAKGEVAYRDGRGTGLTFQDYRGTKTDYGYFVTSPHDEGLYPDVDSQTLTVAPIKQYGGYDPRLGGETPWAVAPDFAYPIGKSRVSPHAYTDSSSSATSMTSGAKVFNGSVNVTHELKKCEPIAHRLQRDLGMSVGVVTSVPFSHATPAAAYAQNVSRDDYQDLGRDMLGLPSIAHPKDPLEGLDVVIGCGWGETIKTEPEEWNKELFLQGKNLVPGNRYITDDDLEAIRERERRPYVLALRTPNVSGKSVLKSATQDAIETGKRLFGFFGVKRGHLPFETANGDFKPVEDVRSAEAYSDADILENPSLSDMTEAAIEVLETNPKGFWLMVEAGDVDWANHANNIDSSIGAVLSGDRAVRSVFNWIESHNAWADSLVIVTADHGHYLNITDPSVFSRRPVSVGP